MELAAPLFLALSCFMFSANPGLDRNPGPHRPLPSPRLSRGVRAPRKSLPSAGPRAEARVHQMKRRRESRSAEKRKRRPHRLIFAFAFRSLSLSPFSLYCLGMSLSKKSKTICIRLLFGTLP